MCACLSFMSDSLVVAATPAEIDLLMLEEVMV